MEASLHDCAGEEHCSCSISASLPLPSLLARKRSSYSAEEEEEEEEEEEGAEEEEEEGAEEEGKGLERDDREEGAAGNDEGNEDEIDFTLHRRTHVEGKIGFFRGDSDDGHGSSSAQSFRESFYSSGTDWSALYSVDEYGIPIEPPAEAGECKTALQATRRKEAMRGKLVQSTLSSFWGSKGEKTGNCRIDDVKKENVSDFLKKFDRFPLATVAKLNPKATNVSTSEIVSSTSIAKFVLKRSRASESAITSSTTATRSDLKASYVSDSVIPSSNRSCPFYKKIPGTTFVVDAFRYGAVAGCSAYFLTHFHTDHYGGLTKSWDNGPIYCTPITARLLALCLRVNERWICPIPLRTAQIIDGVQVRMFDANHCPGAAIILFQLTNGQVILHTGDFRACKEMQSYPEFSGVCIHTLYLDTTYCNQKYRFPLQHKVIEFVVQVAQAALQKNSRTLIVVGAYSIGKERVYLGLAEALNVKIFVEHRRSQILKALEWPELLSRISTDSGSTLLHVLPIGYLRPQKLKAYIQGHREFDCVLAFRPTGWTFSEKVGDQLHLLKPTISGCVTIYGVPYSEHSSFLELQEFVQFLKPQKIIPTVNVGRPQTREQMESYFRQWRQKGWSNCRF